MNELKQALQQAVEALREVTRYTGLSGSLEPVSVDGDESAAVACHAAIVAAKAALARADGRRNDRLGVGPERSTVGWQPIATAPKDNSHALYLARFDDAGELQELDFDGGWEYWQESWELAHINGWAWVSANGIEEPTHWAYQNGAPPPTQSVALVAAIQDPEEAS